MSTDVTAIGDDLTEDGRLVATGRCVYSVKDQEQGPRGFPTG